jgi:hypothetical protein
VRNVSFFRAIRIIHFWRLFCFGRNSTHKTSAGSGILESDSKGTAGKRPMHQGVLPVPSAGIWASIWNSRAGSAAHAAGPERCVPVLIRNLTADHIYLVCGYTDMRKSIDGLAALGAVRFHLDSHQPALFLFYGRRKDRIKALLWDETGFILLYKRLENGRY